MRRFMNEEFPSAERVHHHRGFEESSPLAEAILQHAVPANFKLPNLDPYDGASDPYEHIDHFRTIMRIQRASQALLCHVFPTTLRGQARTWFYSLPSGIINNFEELAKLFVEQFIANRRIIKDSSHLSGIRQSEGESLKEYFQRFSFEARQIPGVDPELLRGVFLGGLRPGPFYSSLMRDTVRTYAALVHRVEAQISADEAISAHRLQFEQSIMKRKADFESTHQQQRQKIEHRGSRNLPPRTSFQHHETQSENEYTPLNTSPTNIFMSIRDEKAVKWPHLLKPNTENQQQYCHFHQNHEHNTETNLTSPKSFKSDISTA